MNTKTLKLTFLWLLFAPGLVLWGQADLRKGATIIAGKEGAVTFQGPDGQPLPAADVELNDALPEGSTITTGADGKVVLLFSNGTVSTLMSDGKLTVKAFLQEAFESAGKKMADLKEEPSQSDLKLNLDFGDLVVGTKTLSKKSSMDITTPSGTAGIRGTQFQVAQQAGGGPMALDVTESTVAFTPKGAAAPTAVGPNRGLDVGAGGAITPRPINPVAAQNVTAANTGAFALTAEVSLGEVSAQMEEAQPEEAQPDEPEESQPEGEEPGGDEPGGETQPSEGEPGKEAAKGDRPPRKERTAQERSRPRVNQDQLLENNPDVKSVRKVGKLDPRTKEMLKLEFSEELMAKFFEYPVDLQENLLSENPRVAQRLMRIKPPVADLRAFYAYDSAVSRTLLNIEDDAAFLNFIGMGYDQDFVVALLTPANLKRLNDQADVQPGSLAAPSDVQLFGSTSSLLELTHANGNDFILSELLESGGGELTDAAIATGLEANNLLTDLTMANDFAPDKVFAHGALDNPFYVDAASVWTLTKSDLGLGDATYLAFAGRQVEVSAGNYDYGPYLSGSVDTVIVSASAGMFVTGEVAFDAASSNAETRVVLMSGESLSTNSGATLSNALSDLVLTARDDVQLLETTLSAGRRLQILGQRDVTLTGGRLEASESVRLQAAKKLHLDSVQFSQGLPSLYMQATTVNLRNVDFPGGSMININSLKGGIDGKYPNFGTESFGRVNFLQNVKYGGNSMHDNPSFDQHGQNITIGKIPGQ